MGSRRSNLEESHSKGAMVARNRWPPAGPRLSRCRRRAGGSHRRCRATMHGASWQHGAPSLASATVADKAGVDVVDDYQPHRGRGCRRYAYLSLTKKPPVAGGRPHHPSSPPKGGDPRPLVRSILTIRTPVQAALAGNDGTSPSTSGDSGILGHHPGPLGSLSESTQ